MNNERHCFSPEQVRALLEGVLDAAIHASDARLQFDSSDPLSQTDDDSFEIVLSRWIDHEKTRGQHVARPIGLHKITLMITVHQEFEPFEE